MNDRDTAKLLGQINRENDRADEESKFQSLKNAARRDFAGDAEAKMFADASKTLMSGGKAEERRDLEKISARMNQVCFFPPKNLLHRFFFFPFFCE